MRWRAPCFLKWIRGDARRCVERVRVVRYVASSSRFFAKWDGVCKKGGVWKARVVVAPSSSAPSRQTSTSTPHIVAYTSCSLHFGFVRALYSQYKGENGVSSGCASRGIPSTGSLVFPRLVEQLQNAAGKCCHFHPARQQASATMSGSRHQSCVR